MALNCRHARAARHGRRRDAPNRARLFAVPDTDGVERRPPPRTGEAVFTQVLIGPCRFAGHLSTYGPYISATPRAGGIALGGVALGPQTRLVKYEPESVAHRNRGYGWYVIKYDRSEPRIPLVDLSDAEAALLAAEFGISMDEGAPDHGFFESPAFIALVNWAGKHPRKARSWSRFRTYMPDWYGRVTAAIARATAASLTASRAV